MENIDSPELPEGSDFLHHVSDMEDECEQITDKWISTAGVQAPKCMDRLGSVLSLGDRVGSCFWHCPGGGYETHVVQYIAARSTSYGRAALRLLRFGFYDEALSLVRSLGEIANLLMLFELDAKAMEKWKLSDLSARNRHFRPAQIRDQITLLGGTIPMDSTKYAQLCELATHPVPELRPQLFNQHGAITVGGYFQEMGALVALNETAALESIIVFLSAKLCNVPVDQRRQIKRACLECVEAAGSVDLSNLPDLLKKSITSEKV